AAWSIVGTFVTKSAATVRVAKTLLLKTSKTIPPLIITIIDFRWMEWPVSFQSETAKKSEAVIIRTHVQGCVRKSIIDRANMAPYLVIEGDFENSKRNVRKR